MPSWAVTGRAKGPPEPKSLVTVQRTPKLSFGSPEAGAFVPPVLADRGVAVRFLRCVRESGVRVELPLVHRRCAAARGGGGRPRDGEQAPGGGDRQRRGERRSTPPNWSHASPVSCCDVCGHHRDSRRWGRVVCRRGVSDASQSEGFCGSGGAPPSHRVHLGNTECCCHLVKWLLLDAEVIAALAFSHLGRKAATSPGRHLM